MDNLIMNKLLVMEILLFPCTLSNDNDDFIYPSDDMFESPNYLIDLNEKITKYLEELNPILIPCLDSFTKYVDYIADKIEVGSNKEVTIIRTFGKAVEGPAFLQTDIDLDTALEVHYWNLSIAQKLRGALDNAQAAWFKLTGNCCHTINLIICELKTLIYFF